MKKILKIIGVVLLVLIILVLVFKSFLIKTGANIALDRMAGMSLTADKFKVGLFHSRADIEGLKVYNPEGFQDRVFIDLPKLYVDYDLFPLLAGKFHAGDIQIHLKEVLLAKNAEGESNIDGFKKMAAGKKEEKPEKKPPAEEEKPTDLYIASLQLKIGRLVLKDYSDNADKPTVDMYNINAQETFKDVKDPQAFAAYVMSKYMAKFVTQAIKNVGLDEVGGVVKGSIGLMGDVGKEAFTTATDIGKGAVDTTTDTIKNTTEGIKNIINLPFGGQKE
ncbi:MAG: hypothetical protein ACLFPX_01825 [Candidatus Omnitrophota bacterium]